MGRILLADLATDRFLKDWAMLYLIGGAVFVFSGLIMGCIIWRKYRKTAEQVEEKNREAMGRFEEISDQVSRLKAELSDGSGE